LQGVNTTRIVDGVNYNNLLDDTVYMSESDLVVVGVSEIAEMAGTSKQAVVNWRERFPDFPKPVAELKSGPVWNFLKVQEWARAHGHELKVVAEKQATPIKDGAVIVAVLNMKGGVGKSTVAANLGWYAAYSKDRRVLLVDLDPQFDLSKYLLGSEAYEKQILEADRATIVDVFEQATPSALAKKPGALVPTDAILHVKRWSDGSLIDLVPSKLDLSWTLRNPYNKERMLAQFLEKVEGSYDLIVIDCPPTESMFTDAAYYASDYVLVPVRTEFLSTVGLPLLVKSLADFKKNFGDHTVKLAGVLFNSVAESKEEHARSKAFVEKVARDNGWYLFRNEITYSDSYPKGARGGTPIFMTPYARQTKKSELAAVTNEFLGRIGIS
jgi:chromosome partitioning protein